MNDKEYLFGFEYQHYCFLCPGVRRRTFRTYYPGGPMQETGVSFPCYMCNNLRLEGGWLIYER